MERTSLGNRWAYGRPHQPFVTRRKRRWSGVAAVTAVIMAVGGVALADNVVNDVATDAGPPETKIPVEIAQGATSDAVNYWIVANSGDGQTGCNAADGSSATVSLSVAQPGVGSITRSPSGNLTFTACGTTAKQGVAFTASANATPGDYLVSATVNDSGSTTTTGTYNVNSATFTIRVVASGPTLTAPVLALPGNISVLATSAAGAVVTYSASASDENGAVAINCSPVSGSTFAPGTTTVNCSATNAAGTTNGSFTVTVSFGFVGFDRPVDNDGVLNVAKAGQAIPLKFQVTGAGGAGISGLNAPPVKVTVANLSCGLDATPDQLEEYAAASSGLQDLGGGYYQFNWKTPKDYAGSCKTMKVDLGDAISHTALFKFTK